MSDHTRAFALLSATDPDNIPIPIRGFHYAVNERDVPAGDIVEWWDPQYSNGYVYVRMEHGHLDMEIDVNAVWHHLVREGHSANHDLDVHWTQRDWQLISRAFDSLRAGYYFSARFQIPTPSLDYSMTFWTFLRRYYSHLLLLGHEHVDNPVRLEENNELWRVLRDENGNEVIDLTGDASTVTTEPSSDTEDVEDWESLVTFD